MSTLPSVIVVRPAVTGSSYVNVMTSPENQHGYLHPGEVSVNSPLVKIQVEFENSNRRFVHLRFSHNNKYWERDSTSRFLKATSNQPVEDTSNPSCTLFEPIFTPGTQNISFIHVQSGGRVQSNSADAYGRLIVESIGDIPNDSRAMFAIINWDTLVMLPKYVAFKGDNGKYLRGVMLNRSPYQQFSGDDIYNESVGYEVFSYHDGHIRIKSDFFDRFWRSGPTWIWADVRDTNNDTLNINPTTLYWAVKVNDTTIALRIENGLTNELLFCMRFAGPNPVIDCLRASSNNISREARLELEELVLDRNIYNVVYRMEDSRIYDETPFVAGSNSASNATNTESTLSISVSYTETTSNSFTHSLSVELGVTTSFRTGVPFIAQGGIEHN